MSISLGPWPLGIDNVHGPSHRVFQVPGQGQPPARLRAASNVDLDDEGWPSSRAGTSVVGSALTAGARVFSADGTLFVQDDETLAWDDDGLVEELAAPLITHEWPTGSGRLWCTDGTQKFQIRDGLVKPWGLAKPVPVLVDLEDGVTGALRAGTYLVATTLRSGALNSPTAQESGAYALVEVELEAVGGFTVEQVVSDPNASHVAFYVSAVNGSEPLLVTIIAVTEDPDTHVRSASLTLTDPDSLGATRLPLLTLGAGAPPNGITTLGSLQAFMLVGAGANLYRSRPGQPWLFDLGTAIQVFPAVLTTIVGLQTGAWVGTQAGLYWVSGDAPESWRRVRACSDTVLPHGAVIPGGAIPALQVDAMVALFAVPTGFVAGLPDGSIRRLTQDRYHLPTATAVRIVYHESARRFYVAVTEP